MFKPLFHSMTPYIEALSMNRPVKPTACCGAYCPKNFWNCGLNRFIITRAGRREACAGGVPTVARHAGTGRQRHRDRLARVLVLQRNARGD